MLPGTPARVADDDLAFAAADGTGGAAANGAESAPLRRMPTAFQGLDSPDSPKKGEKKQFSGLEGLPEGVDHSTPDIGVAWQWFQRVDEDNSGILDKEEVAVLMKHLGMEMSKRRVNRAYNEMCSMTPFGGREGVAFEDFASWCDASGDPARCAWISDSRAPCAGGRATRRYSDGKWGARSKSCSSRPTPTSPGSFRRRSSRS